MKALMRAAVFAALVFSSVALPGASAAQDVTLTSRDGALALSGILQGFDGEFYRIETSYGPLTLDAAGVICDGPACPDLTAPKATIRVVGAPEAGAALIPALVSAFAAAQGLTEIPGPITILADPVSGKTLAEFSFQALAPDEARSALVAGRAELMLAAATEAGLGTRAIGLDALVPIIAPDNPIAAISTPDLARVLAGEVTNWAEVGGADMPLVLHGLDPESDLQMALSARLGREIAASITHAGMAELAAAVARDPWAIAVTARTAAGSARVPGLVDSCGFPLLPSALAIKAEDYPLSLPIFFLTPRRRLPLVAREFLDFLVTPSGQQAVDGSGYVGRGAVGQPMTNDGLRLINAIQGAGEETTLTDLKRLVDLMDGADRISLTFRFADGSAELDAHSRDNLVDLARLLEIGHFNGRVLVLAGFSDGSGAAAANLALSQDRANRVLSALKDAAPSLLDSQLPQVQAFGEALPMACDETAAGRRLNRRVELWAIPAPPQGATP